MCAQAANHNQVRTKQLTKQRETHTAALAGLCQVYTKHFAVPALKGIPTVNKHSPIADGKFGKEETTVQRALGMLFLAQHGAGGPGKNRAVDQKLKTTLGKYDVGRAAVTQRLIPVLLNDVRDYQTGYDESMSTVGPDVEARLQAVARAVNEDIAHSTPDDQAPANDDPRYIIYNRAMAADASVQLYKDLERMVAGLNLGANAVVFPG